ncbi:hypothetical protein CO058_03420 [candidate division WWE3 bacterium CG_4_9_14_0_2_um_filter_35_11]|uniref:Nudix hydrolase domain-containing protein n=1 Tax=candidate division WWE3 bacterium CG_4_9_14_0_2_um_filter_35_11 TaxID=1975077 RepID=A0A2M8EL78_UNCKA|nr:MAG: hypothetical protein COV25_00815 [candidate division WWE3 bacterium CG10_big_fil_rev_8_21_14_0_10_35_32]PJC23457.1 MAG: hypothetical protein CO058_03420 [candidate division WWE3 bacterium CG_4_9_14_0_2_um_filter_35_11]
MSIKREPHISKPISFGLNDNKYPTKSGVNMLTEISIRNCFDMLFTRVLKLIIHLEDNPNKLRITVEAFIVHKDEILLFKRDNKIKVFPGFWSVLGGHIDFSEDPLTACIREIKEETGLVVSCPDLKLKFISYHYHIDRNETWNIFGFFASVSDKSKTVSSDEGKSRWIPLEKVSGMDLFPPVAHYLDHTLNRDFGLLYSVSEWENAKLVKVLSEKSDRDD